MPRVELHPVLGVPAMEKTTFYFEGQPLTARKGEPISSALFANGIRTFGLHPHDKAPQGIFCANGQCSQCLVVADGLPVKSCMEPVTEGMRVQPLTNLPTLPDVDRSEIELHDIEELECDLLVIGGGPSGLGAAIEAAQAGLSVIVVDDKDALGGKLVLQTHPFFGSVDECFAGTRGVDIANLLARQVATHDNVKIMTSTMAVGIYDEGKVGVVEKKTYKLITPKSLLVAAGAREKALLFPGCDLPGVYGAGAFQTLLNRDLVKPSEKLFIVGGGNVGVIAGYHALQAGIKVVGLIEGLPDVGSYWVHADKLRRLGVPIYTSTSVVCANGKDAVESVTVAQVDEKWDVVPGTFRTYACDTLLLAVGLDSINELHEVAVKFGIDSHLAGDAEEIAEASAAMFSGRLAGRKIAQKQGKDVTVPAEWEEMTKILKSKPGRENKPAVIPEGDKIMFPVIWCTETIPCNPCAEVCSQGAIKIPSGTGITNRPEYSGFCSGCVKCVAACPGLAITMVDKTERTPGKASVSIPFEMPLDFEVGDTIKAVGPKGEDVCEAVVSDIQDKRSLAPCRAACPAGVRAQGYIEMIRKGDFEQAIEILRRDLPLPGVCGRVCYYPCESVCHRGDIDEPVAILGLKRFAADWAKAHEEEVRPLPVTRDERIAVVGSGPAGLACANEILRRGYRVTVFEAADQPGGMLRYGIPAYRLPDDVLDYDINYLERLGVEIKTKHKIGNVSALLSDGYGAVFAACGVQDSAKMAIEGEDLEGVRGMLEFLRETNRGAGKKLKGTVAIIGGGNSAMDAARVALRLGADEVKVLYRRSREQMPAHDWEIEETQKEGVTFAYLTNPVRALGKDGRVTALECVRMKLGEADKSGRARPIPIEGSEFEVPVDTVVVAIGQTPRFEEIGGELKTSKWGTFEAADVTQATNLEGVFAGGDAVTGAATIVEAFGAGKRAAESIDRYLRGIDIAAERDVALPVAKARNVTGVEKAPRVAEKKLAAAERTGHFGEIVSTMSEEQAVKEASRCLGCGLYVERLPGGEATTRNPAVAGQTRSSDRSVVLTLEVDKEHAVKIAGVRIQDEEVTKPIETIEPPESDDDVVVCRCERVTLGELRKAIRAGVRDMNQLKAMFKIGMGACGAKTCGPLLRSVFGRQGIPPGEVTPLTRRPLVAEVPMGMFAGVQRRNGGGEAE